MSKVRFLILIVITTLALVSCGNLEETKIISPSKAKALELVQSFGNQNSKQHGVMERYASDDNRVYVIDESYAEGGESEGGKIVAISLNNPKKQEIIYQGKYLGQISVMDDWVFFTEGVEEDLYKIKKDGGEKTKLASKVSVYILTERQIYYQTYELRIYTMSLDGSHIRDILGPERGLIGIDRGWIYFYMEAEDHEIPEEEMGPYRIRADGTGKEVLLGPDVGILESFTVENDELFFIRYDGQRTSVVKKTINGGETILTSIPGDLYLGSPINKENDWIYFRMGKELYRINADGKGEKELIYRASSSIDSILLDHGAVLITTISEDAMYIQRDGTVIDLGKSLN